MPPSVSTTEQVFDAKQVETWVKTLIDANRTWRERQDAAARIGSLARKLRRRDELHLLLEVLRAVPRFAEETLSIATNLDLREPLRRTTAWTLSQISDWPRYFNERVLDDKELEPHTTIDASLPFFPELGHAHELPASDQLSMAQEFLPHLDGIGFELQWDTKNHYVGPFFRVLEHPDDSNRRCIQYVYVWSKQVWPISAFFTFYFWPFLSTLALVPWLLGGELIATITIATIGFLLMAIGTHRTLRPKEMRSFKNDTWYVAGGGLLLLALPLLPWGALIPLCSAIGLFLFRRFVLGETQHLMDYGPIFIYVKRKSDSWILERARIDKFHYETVELGTQELNNHARGSTLFLMTDNIWRSMKFATAHGSHSVWSYRAYLGAWAGLYVSTVGMIFVMLLERLSLVFGPLAIINIGLMLGWSTMASLGLIALNEMATTPISDPERPRSINGRFLEQPEKRVLNTHKLVHLWNMADDKANLVIRKKLQNPFRTAGDKSFWRTFRDPSAERLAYEASSGLQRHERLGHR